MIIQNITKTYTQRHENVRRSQERGSGGGPIKMHQAGRNVASPALHPTVKRLTAYAAVYHCTSIHISQWLKIHYGQRSYQICMKHDLKFSSDIMLSDENGKKSIFVGNGCLKWPRCTKKH
jgi:hypothetical protein